jgi:hypothetical protein
LTHHPAWRAFNFFATGSAEEKVILERRKSGFGHDGGVEICCLRTMDSEQRVDVETIMEGHVFQI